MPVLDVLSAADLSAVIATFRDGLKRHREVINRLNVYPVPDGDTGTNMSLTMESVVTELSGVEGVDLEHPEQGSADLDAVCKAIVHGSLMGARGNSGVILSQLLRGLCEGLNVTDGAPGGAALTAALTRADELAREAVMRPVEGTILTVARGAAEGAQGALVEAEASLADVIRSAREGALEALARTPSLLPVLAQAGVVDSGGTGYILLFDALCTVVMGEPMPEPPPLPEGAGPGLDVEVADVDKALADLRYEVMYLLEAPDDRIPAFKEVWAGLGDSIVVVGGDGLWNCHIHTDEVGPSIEACLDAGRPRNIRVTDLLEEVEEEKWVREAAASADVGPSDVPLGPAPATGVVAVASGDGIGRIFRSLGVEGLIAGGQSMNPSIAELVASVDALRSDEVIVLPNNSNIKPVANRVDELSAKQVWVVPTDTIAEGFAALLAYDPAAGGAENAAAMEASARRVIPGEVTRAVRSTDSPAGPITTGDWLGLSREGIEVVADSLPGVACLLLEHLMTDEHDLLTIIEGDGASSADTRRITEWVKEHRPAVETEVHHGGQPLYPYLFSIE